MLLGNGSAGRDFNIALPRPLLSCLKAQIGNLALAGFTRITLTRFGLGFSTCRLSGNSGFASCLFGRFGLARSRSSRRCSARRRPPRNALWSMFKGMRYGC
jgi:hypothetical protein